MVKPDRSPLPGVRVVHVVYGEILHTIVDSQVIEPLAALAEGGLAVELIAFVTPKVLVSPGQRRRHKERLQRLRRRLPEVPIRMMVHMPRHTGNFVSSRRLVRVLKPGQVNAGPTIIHCHGLFAAGVARRLHDALPRCALLYQQRGDIAAQMASAGRVGADGRPGWSERRARKFAKAEAKAIGSADKVIAVSSILAALDEKTYGAAAGKLRIQPAVVDTGRFQPDAASRIEVRSELGIPEDSPVIVYAGSYAPWQLPLEIGRLTARAVAADPRTVLLLLTRDDAPFRKGCRQAGVPENNVRVFAPSFDLMPRYLQAADAGLLLREENAINHAASPAKGAEYLACGLPILLSPSIGDFSARVLGASAGVSVPSLDSAAYDRAVAELAELRRDGELTQRCSRLAGLHHSLARGVESLLQDYRELADSLQA